MTAIAISIIWALAGVFVYCMGYAAGRRRGSLYVQPTRYVRCRAAFVDQGSDN